MNTDKRTYSRKNIDGEERIARFILKPRDWDMDDDVLAANFVSLRDGEDGVSCVRYDYLGGETGVIQHGTEHAMRVTRGTQKDKPDAPIQQLVGWGHCTVDEIIALDPKVISFQVDGKKPYHICITFSTDGKIVEGMVKDAYILELFELIEDTFEYYYLS